jgi:hypothetical protein
MKQIMTYLPARSPVILDQLIILLRELVGLRISGPGGIRRNHAALTVLVRQVIRGKLDQCNARLEVTLLAWRPVDADIKLNATVLDAVVNLDVGVVVVSQDRDIAYSAVMELLVDEVEDEDLVLINLFGGIISSVCSKVNA